MAKIRPHIVCADGFKLSVQTGECMWCTPREDRGPWMDVEVGVFQGRIEGWEDHHSGCEENGQDFQCYGYVPVEKVWALIEAHGGLKEPIPGLVAGNWWPDLPGE
jgi:hypothetical protein